MKELLIAIASGLVQDPAAVTVVEDAPDAEGVIVYHLHVAADDMGIVQLCGQIGFSGYIASLEGQIANLNFRALKQSADTGFCSRFVMQSVYYGPAAFYDK